MERLTGRGTETEEVIQRRLQTAKVEMASQSEFDHVVVNDDVNQAVAAISSLLKPEN